MNMVNNRRLEKAERLLVLASDSGHLRDRRTDFFGDIDAKSRVWSAVQLIRQAIAIQKGEQP